MTAESKALDEVAGDEGMQEPDWGLVVSWFRLERNHQLTRILMVGAPLVLIGDVCAGFAIAFEWMGPLVQTVVLVVGIVATAAGPGYVIWKLRHLWGEDHYVALGTKGLRYVGKEGQWFLPWEEVEEISLREEAAVAIGTTDGPAKLVSGPFAGTTAPELVKTIETVRRKALFGLYNT